MTPFIISTKTRIYGIIGDPLEHSVSPAMQNAAFQYHRLNNVYIPFRISANNLTNAIIGIRAMGIGGLNVTIPHKVSVMPLLDEIDSLAAGIGAVNVIVNHSGKLIGYNTDAYGILRALLEHNATIANKNAVILGAGGAARAALFILAREKANITVINRTLAHAKECADRLVSSTNIRAAALELNANNLESALKQADILINTTSIGMHPNAAETPVPAPLLHPGMTVMDAVYNPLATRLLTDAKKAGAATVSGVEMLVWQGAIAFEKWTGLKAPVNLMRRKALNELKKFKG